MKRSTRVGRLVAAALLSVGVWCAQAAAFPLGTPGPLGGQAGGHAHRPGFRPGGGRGHAAAHHAQHHRGRQGHQPGRGHRR